MTLSTRDREPEPVPPLAGPSSSATTAYLAAGGIAAAFARVVASTPDATAVVSAGRRFSYREIDRRADLLADGLPDHVGVESVVGVCLRPGVDLVAAVLAVARRGAAFLLMDPAHPRARLAHLVRAAGARCVFVPRGLSDAPIGDSVPIVAAHDPSAPDLPTRSPQRGRPDNLGYVVFTSGSTGAPKPVGVDQGALLNLIRWTAGEYRMRPDDRLLPTHAPGFDASVRELLLPLLTGASLVLGDGDERFEPARLLDVVSAEGVTLLDVVPTLLSRLLDEPQAGTRLAPVRLMTCGGEELPASTARRLRTVAPWIRLYNQYGPSEATVAATSWSCADQDDDERLPIGTAIAGVRAYVLDQDLRPVARGVPGELVLGGRGVARGYLGAADWTAERFLPDPFHGAAGTRMYRTGDLVRVRDDGNLVFLGRLDDQVSVGGHRIEPGEVAATLRRFPAVTDAAVVPVHDGPGAPCLAAYVVPAGDGVDESALRGFLAERLPSFMMPRHLAMVDRLPVTDTGKIDRDRLPAPVPPSGTRRPGTDTERAIAEVVGAVLELSTVGADDDVFALGADSLDATRIAIQAGTVLGVHLDVHDVFTHRSVAALAEAAASAPPARDLPGDEADAAPDELSLAQRRLWFLDQLNPGNIAYNVGVGYHVSGELDVTALTEALRAVAVRHECLRGTIVAQDGRPQVRLLPPEQVVDQLTVRPVGSPGEAESVARAEAAEPFDLAAGPLMRATVLRIGPTEHMLLVVVHHLVFDGWSLGPFERHLSAAYRDALLGRPHSPAAGRQYRHFVAWQRRHLSEERISEVVGYWSRSLSGLDLVLEMPADRAHPAMPSYRAAAVPVGLPASVAADLRRLAGQRRATLFMVTFAVYQLLIGRYTGRDAFVVGCPSVGRSGSDFEEVVGFFVNTLPMRADLSGDPSFAGLVERVRETATSAYAHQDLPFERLAEHLAPARDLNRNPVVQIWFDLFTAPDSLDLPGATTRWHPPATVATRFDLELHLSESPSGALSGELVYATDLYERETVEQYARHFESLARLVAARPDVPLSEIDMLRDEERDRILRRWTDTAAPYRADRTVPTLFEEQVARTPDDVALVSDGVRLSFAELNRRANRLAHHLRGRGVRRGQVVGLFLPPGPDAVVSLLAVVKAGAGYLPVDVDSPAERVAFMLADAGAKVVLTLTALVPDLPPSDLDDVVRVDADSAAIAGCAATDPTRTTGPDDLLYVIYTSGSTGRPKGVVMTHRPLLNLLDWQLRRAEAAGPTLQFSALHFDISFQEMFSSWLCGRQVVLLDRDQRRDPEQLLSVMTANGVRRLFCTPLVLEQIAQAAAGGTDLPPLVQIATAGEQLHLTAEVRDLLRRLPGVVLDNQYGPTEAHVVTAEMLSGDPQDWPVFPLVGSAIANTRIYLLDERMRPVPPRAAGEVYVGGTCLARGYIGRPDLTADRFVPDPFDVEPGARLYRTGDLARWTLDGRIEFLGRTDHQVKVRGYRIEPGEIEVSLTGHPDVAEAAVLAVGHGASRSLVAYLVPRRDGTPDPGELRGFLLARLPAYMIPSAFVTVPALPLTAAGKLDRVGLAALDDHRGDAERDSATLQPHERIIADIWAGHLSGRVGLDEDFFGLGGHSLMATSVVHEIRTAFDIALPLRAIFENRTVRELAATVAAAVVAQIEAMTDDDVAAAVHDATPHGVGNVPAGHGREPGDAGN
ncbi:amino acid adenylation domain-containing protein [Micromonospora sp. NPDC047812]|uniref:amino acid adenylation domain-containing protein n=1 Tax=Micromonospora sp. NPDC047812 TaxID=3155742 RepID=UPI003453EC61